MHRDNIDFIAALAMFMEACPGVFPAGTATMKIHRLSEATRTIRLLGAMPEYSTAPYETCHAETKAAYRWTVGFTPNLSLIVLGTLLPSYKCFHNSCMHSCAAANLIRSKGSYIPCRRTNKKRGGDELESAVVKMHTSDQISRGLDADIGQRQLAVSATHYDTAWERASPAADSGLDGENALQARGDSISLAVRVSKLFADQSCPAYSP